MKKERTGQTDAQHTHTHTQTLFLFDVNRNGAPGLQWSMTREQPVSTFTCVCVPGLGFRSFLMSAVLGF